MDHPLLVVFTSWEHFGTKKKRHRQQNSIPVVTSSVIVWLDTSTALALKMLAISRTSRRAVVFTATLININSRSANGKWVKSLTWIRNKKLNQDLHFINHNERMRPTVIVKLIDVAHIVVNQIPNNSPSFYLNKSIRFAHLPATISLLLSLNLPLN